MADEIDVAKYKGETVSGMRWLRSWRVIALNPFRGVPTVQFEEEQITETEGVVHSKQMETLSLTFDPDAVFQLYNPLTGDQIPGATMKQSDVFVALYSVYRTLAAARDAAKGQ
jgi:hypothetical protein